MKMVKKTNKRYTMTIRNKEDDTIREVHNSDSLKALWKVYTKVFYTGGLPNGNVLDSYYTIIDNETGEEVDPEEYCIDLI